jgi:competence protein ComEC
VGEGAIRVTTGLSDIEIEEPGEAAATDAGAAPLSTRAKARPSLADAVSWPGEQAARQADRWTLWTPVALGCGAGSYFARLREPQAWVGLFGVGIGIAAILILRASRWSRARALRGRRPWTWGLDRKFAP